MTTAVAVPRIRCPRCDAEVPDGNFCGLCGSDLTAGAGDGPQWLRRKTFGAAPGEAVLRPYLISALFPQLPTRSRVPFRLALIAAGAVLLASALARTPSVAIAVGSLGLPLLFWFYLRASGIYRDIRTAAMVFAVATGAALGALWVFLSGQFVARNYDVPMAVGLALHHLLQEGLLIPLVGMAMMVVPLLALRAKAFRRRGPAGTRPETLDGFVLGAMVALAFSATATLTRLGAQVEIGLIAHARPVIGLIVQAVLCGVTVPITAAAAGAMMGIALWFTPAGIGEHHSRVRPMLALLAAAALLIHAGVGVIDIVGFNQLAMLAAHLLSAVLVLLALRLSLQLALLHEAHDPAAFDEPILCEYCAHVVPDGAFCPACGVATRASSRQSRRERRGRLRPEAVADAGDGAGQVFPGYALPAARYLATAPQRPRFGWLLSRWGTLITAAAVALGAVALVLTPDIAHFMCPPDCGKPPSGTPVAELPTFTAADGSFSVSYPAPGSAYSVRREDSGVTATYTGGDGGLMQLFGEPAAGRSAEQIARAVLKKAYPDATVAYVIPNAMVGYRDGYGFLADDWPQGANASYRRVRILVMVSVKDGVALTAFASGPYHAFGPDFGPGLPSAANLEIAGDMGKYVNSFRWRGDAPR